MYLGVLADRDMLLQAAINLLSNAVKYTPARRPRHASQPAGRRPACRFEVEDTGVGLSPEDCSKVFEKFYRVKKDQKMAAGTGLGLPLAKHIVEDVHGGTLDGRSSALGEGSTFIVTLPDAGSATVSPERTHLHDGQSSLMPNAFCSATTRSTSFGPPSSSSSGPASTSTSPATARRPGRPSCAAQARHADHRLPDAAAGRPRAGARRVREQPDASGLPVLMLTAKGFELGHDELARLSARRGPGQAVQPASAPSRSAASPTARCTLPSRPPFNASPT